MNFFLELSSILEHNVLMRKLDERDIQILSILQEDGRITKKALAGRLNLSLTPSWDRIKRLEKDGIIEGYHAKLSSLFFNNFYLVITEIQLKSNNDSASLLFESAINKFDEVLSCWKVGGSLDYILRVITKDEEAYEDFIRSIFEADIGLNHYNSYPILNKKKDSKKISKSLIRQSGLAKNPI